MIMLDTYFPYVIPRTKALIVGQSTKLDIA
jgi:hypothetical protein